MRRLKNENGITLVSLAVTIAVMMILAVTISASLEPTIELKKYNSIKEDIIALTEEIKLYYLENGTLPVVKNLDGTYDTTKVYNLDDYGVPTEDRNPNDSGNYYFIKVALLNDINLNNGLGNTNSDYTTDDVYVVNEKSLTVYYLQGAVLNGKKHYTIVDDFAGGSYAEDYYAKTDLPIISAVTTESNGKSKYLAGIGDTITLKMLTNYELTTTPTVTINNETVEVTWDGNIGTATYTVPETYDTTQYGTKIPLSISNYSADNRVGEEITDVNFGQGVYSYAKPFIELYKLGLVKIGNYVNYTYDTVTEGYLLLAKYSGYDSNQTVAQSSTILKWKILNIDEENEKVDLISETATDNTVYFQGALGYNNGVYLLNDICKKLYSNSTLGITARSINLADTEKNLTETGIAARKAYKVSDSKIQYGGTKTYTGSYSYYPNLYANQLGAGINTTTVTSPSDMTVPDPYDESNPLITAPTTETSTQASTGGLTVTTTEYPNMAPFDETNYGAAGNLLYSNGKRYWVASHCTACGSTVAYFGLRVGGAYMGNWRNTTL